jgi:hypothetical protein
MATFSKKVIADAFDQVVGGLAPAVLEDCVNDFSSSYTVVGREEAFKASLAAHAPSVDSSTHDNLYTRFDSALWRAQTKYEEELKEKNERRERRQQEARTEAERATARQEAADLKREVSDKVSDFKRVLNDTREANREILSEAREIRKLARESEYGTAEVVVRSLEATNEIAAKDGEADRLIKDCGEIAKEAQEAARNNDAASIEASTNAIEAILNRFRDILAVDLPEAQALVEAAITTASDEKAAKEEEAAIQKAVTTAKADLDAVDGVEGIAKRVEAAVRQYKLDYTARNGSAPNSDEADPLNPDRLTEAANNALEAAKTANDDVVREAEAKDLTATEAAAARVATEKSNAQAALNDITGRSGALKQAEALEGAKETYTGKVTKKEEEEKAKKTGQLKRFLSSWQGHLTIAGLFLVGIILSLVFAPWWVQVGVVITALVVLAGYGFSFLKGEPERGVIALGGHFVIVVIILIFMGLVPLIGKGPGSHRDLIPSDPTATATSSAQQVGDYPTQAELDADATATAEASATEAANNP